MCVSDLTSSCKRESIMQFILTTNWQTEDSQHPPNTGKVTFHTDELSDIAKAGPLKPP